MERLVFKRAPERFNCLLSGQFRVAGEERISISTNSPLLEQSFDNTPVLERTEAADFSPDCSLFLQNSPSSNVSFTYLEPNACLVVRGPESVLVDQLPYIVYNLSEVPRQKRGKVTFHGAAVSKQGEAVMIMGDKGHGKTTLAYQLCRDHGYQLIGNDILVIGHLEKGLGVFRGDGEFKMRRLAAERHFPKLLEQFSTTRIVCQGQGGYEEKMIIKASDLGLQAPVKSFPVRQIIQIFLDGRQEMPLQVNPTNKDSLALRLRIYENTARYILGATAPILGKDGKFVGRMPYLDSETLAQKRLAVLERIFSLGITCISGGDLAEISHLVAKGLR